MKSKHFIGRPIENVTSQSYKELIQIPRPIRRISQFVSVSGRRMWGSEGSFHLARTRPTRRRRPPAPGSASARVGASRRWGGTSRPGPPCAVGEGAVVQRDCVYSGTAVQLYSINTCCVGSVQYRQHIVQYSQQMTETCSIN